MMNQPLSSLCRCCAAFALLGCGCLSACGQGAAAAESVDKLQPIVPRVGIGTMETVAPSGKSSDDLTIVKPSIAPKGVATINAARNIVQSQVLSGTLDVEEAWQSGALKANDVLRLLQEVRLVEGPRNEELRRELAGLLVRHAPERVKDTKKLGAMTRLALAHYYSNNRDERAVELCEGLMRELDAKLKSVEAQGKEAQAAVAWPKLWSIIYLAEYYRNVGQLQQAAETWLRSEKYFRDVVSDAQSAAGIVIDAARMYVQMGGGENEQKAKELYDRVPKYNSEFMSGVALSDQANRWVQQGKYEEARKTLEHLLAQSSSTKPLSSMQRLTCLSTLGYLHYLKGDWVKARTYYNQVLSFGDLPIMGTVPVYITHGFAKYFITESKEMLSRIEKWQSQPIVCDPSEINIVVSQEKTTDPVVRRFLVNTFDDVAISVSSSDARIKVRVKESPWEVDVLPLQHQKQIVLEFAPDVLQKGTEATLTISSPAVGAYKTSVPVSVTVKKSQ